MMISRPFVFITGLSMRVRHQIYNECFMSIMPPLPSSSTVTMNMTDLMKHIMIKPNGILILNTKLRKNPKDRRNEQQKEVHNPDTPRSNRSNTSNVTTNLRSDHLYDPLDHQPPQRLSYQSFIFF